MERPGPTPRLGRSQQPHVTLYDGSWYGENIAPGNAFWNGPYVLPLGGPASEPYQLGFSTVYGTDTALSLPTANLLLGDAPTESVPEPGTYILCGAALLALGLHRRAGVK